MASIDFKGVGVDFPIFNATGRSLKKRLIQVATGGQIGADAQGRVTVRALDNLNFSVQDGERVALLGHNGAGKSTLLRMISGIYHPSTGQINTIGNIGSLIDISLGIDPEATGRENILLRGALLGLSKKEIAERINEIIEFSELGDFIEMPLRTYSSGMQLRLAFAVSTIVRPQILIMDEWLSVGDEKFKHKAEVRLVEMVESTNILILASHSKGLVLNTCTRAIWLEHGRIIMDGPAQDVCDKYFS